MIRRISTKKASLTESIRRRSKTKDAEKLVAKDEENEMVEQLDKGTNGQNMN